MWHPSLVRENRYPFSYSVLKISPIPVYTVRPKKDSNLIVENVEGVGHGTGLGLDIDAVVLVHGPLAEDDPVKGTVEADLDLHVGLAAHHLQAGQVCHVLGPLNVPEVHIVDALQEDGGPEGAQEEQGDLKLS